MIKKSTKPDFPTSLPALKELQRLLAQRNSAFTFLAIGHALALKERDVRRLMNNALQDADWRFTVDCEQELISFPPSLDELEQALETRGDTLPFSFVEQALGPIKHDMQRLMTRAEKDTDRFIVDGGQQRISLRKKKRKKK